MVSNQVSDLIGKLKARRLEIALSLAEGVPIESYQRFSGVYAGLGEALDILDDLLKEKDEDY